MVLADTSVWVEHFRHGNTGLENQLNDGDVVCHQYIIGELACGNLSNRAEIISLLRELPLAKHAEHEEVMHLIESYKLMGKGLGYIDMHLIASALLSEVTIWTHDRKLKEVSSQLGLDFQKHASR